MSDLYRQLLSERAAELLSSPDNALPTRAIGGLLSAAHAAKNYDYPDTALGLLALPAKALTGVAGAAVDQIDGAMREAPDTVAGLNDGSQNTELALGLLGTNAVLPFRAPAGSLSAHVWQGGPHKYGPGDTKDSLKHVGKGEGAQAYGWGRYDAGAREVGEIYQKQLKPTSGVEADQYVSKLQFKSSLLEKMREKYPDMPDEARVRNAENATTMLWREAEKRKDGPLSDPVFFDAFFEQQTKMGDDLSEALKVARDEMPRPRWREGESHLYKHDLPDEDIARYLDWDAPLSDQPESVRGVLASLGVKESDHKSGKDFYESVAATVARETGRGGDSVVRMDPMGASELLARAGIPGLKYYDGMSRGKGEGSRNYVTWDQDVLNRMQMLERNGKPVGLLDVPEDELIVRGAK